MTAHVQMTVLVFGIGVKAEADLLEENVTNFWPMIGNSDEIEILQNMNGLWTIKKGTGDFQLGHLLMRLLPSGTGQE